MGKLVTAWIAASGICLGASAFANEDGFARERKGAEEENAAKDALEGKAPPPIADATGWMNTDDGEALSWQDLKGKVVLIDFWGVWCGPCKRAIPELKAMAEKYADDGLVVIGMHTASSADEGPAYVREKEIGYPVAFDTNDEVIRRFHVDSYPDFYLVDRQGLLRFADIANDEAERAIEMLLAEPAPKS